MADFENSDSDNCEEFNNDCKESIFAEVLFPFKAVGSQELALEKGALIEVFKRESGPWWWGQIKHDAIVLSSDESQEGWFPKDFVRVIPAFPKPMKTTHSNKPALVEAINCDINFPKREYDSTSSNTTTATTSTTATTTSSTTLITTMLPPSPSTTSLQNSKAHRDSVIKELLDTEINYVNLLRSLCVGLV